MNFDTDAIVTLVGIIAGLIGGLAGAYFTSASQRAKVKFENEKSIADTNEVIRKTVMELIQPLRERIDMLESELADWMDWAGRLVKQIKAKGDEPVPFKNTKKEQT